MAKSRLLAALAAAAAVSLASAARAGLYTDVVEPGQHYTLQIVADGAHPFYGGTSSQGALYETLTIWAERPFSQGSVSSYYNVYFAEQSFDGSIWHGDSFPVADSILFATGQESVARYVVPIYIPWSFKTYGQTVCCAAAPPYPRPGFFVQEYTPLSLYIDLDIPDGDPVTRFWVRTPVPEPAGWALMIGGFALLGAALRRRRAEGLQAGAL